MSTSPSASSINVAANGVWVVVSATGELDLVTAPHVRDAVVAALSESKRVVIDLSAVTFMDSSGLRMLTQSQRAVSNAAGDLRVVAPAPGRVYQLLEMTRMLDVFSVHETLEAAIAAV